MTFGVASRSRTAVAVLLSSISILAVAPAMAQDTGDAGGQRVDSYSGVDFAEDSFSFYSGVIIALNGSFDRDGFLLRLDGSRGEYDYQSEDVIGGKVDAEDDIFDVMVGYQKTIGVVTATGYVGYQHRDIDLSPNDPGNEIQGEESGFIVAFDAETSDEIPHFIGFSTSYSTAFDAFDAMLRVGYNMKRMVVGVEGSYSSEESDESERLGGFATFRFDLSPSMPAELTLSAGHQFVDEGGNSTSGGEGAYGSVGFSIAF